MTATLLATDQQRSVLHALGGGVRHPIAYSPYGHHPADSGLLSLLGFHGERRDPVTGHYLLGNGYRAFNPVLMRFNSPDSWSPFGMGGLNAYAYGIGNPHRLDPTGHISLALLALTQRSSSAATLQLASAGSSGALASSSISRVAGSVPAPSSSPIAMPSFNYRTSVSGHTTLQSANGRGSLESLASSSSLSSRRSSQSISQFGSTDSINSIDWSDSLSSTGTPSSSPGRRAPSIDSDWSGSGRPLSRVQVDRVIAVPPALVAYATTGSMPQPQFPTFIEPTIPTPAVQNGSVRRL
ncbi:RHS repeat-associated core domain-containing protein [Pseudomonas sp. NPDC087626]|uniref:RHS repeat-associated core domain-containing protein n=1 Tax=Pseudomonas sp. NPDC087626 TaxID=3364444 RepID=UPI0037F79815